MASGWYALLRGEGDVGSRPVRCGAGCVGLGWGAGTPGSALRVQEEVSPGSGLGSSLPPQLLTQPRGARSTQVAAGRCWEMMAPEAAAARHVGMLYSGPVALRGRGHWGPLGGSGDMGVTTRRSFPCMLHLCAPLSTDLRSHVCSLSWARSHLSHPGEWGPTVVGGGLPWGSTLGTHAPLGVPGQLPACLGMVLAVP